MPKGISIHIGLNTVDPEHYQGWGGPLQACEHDAQDLLRVADSRGFQSQLLLTREATRESVAAEIRRAAEGLDEGGILMLTYSGHGGQVPDYDLDEGKEELGKGQSGISPGISPQGGCPGL